MGEIPKKTYVKCSNCGELRWIYTSEILLGDPGICTKVYTGRICGGRYNQKATKEDIEKWKKR